MYVERDVGGGGAGETGAYTYIHVVQYSFIAHTPFSQTSVRGNGRVVRRYDGAGSRVL